MKYRQRTFYTDKQKSQMWDRWERGESLSSIGRAFNRASSLVYLLLARTGGICPPKRVRSRLAFIRSQSGHSSSLPQIGCLYPLPGQDWALQAPV